MRKFITTVVLPIAAVTIIYKWRYRLLNILLDNDSIRRVSVRTAMGIPGVRSRLLSRAFRS